MALGLVLTGCATTSEPIAYADDGRPIHGRRFTPRDQDASVTLNCRVAAEGRLTDCRVVRESPAGQGFAEATLQVVAEGRIKRRSQRQGQRVEFTTRFQAEN